MPPASASTRPCCAAASSRTAPKHFCADCSRRSSLLLCHSERSEESRILLRAQGLHLASYFCVILSELSLCHSERSEESRIFLSARKGTPCQHSSMRRKNRLPNGHISCYSFRSGCRSQTSWRVACRIGHTPSLLA